MLTSLKITNFRKFINLDLQNFSRVNVFIGSNGSGKTTVLESIKLNLHNIYDIKIFNYTNNIDDYNINQFKCSYINLFNKSKHHILLNFLKEVDNKILNLNIIDNEIYVDIGSDKVIPLNSLGHGILKMISLISMIIHSKDQIILIDEIENGIYYKNISKLIKVIDKLSNEFNVQLFITTHSNDFINGLDGFSNLSFYRLNQNFDGGVMYWDRKKVMEYINDNSIDVR